MVSGKVCRVVLITRNELEMESETEKKKSNIVHTRYRVSHSKVGKLMDFDFADFVGPLCSCVKYPLYKMRFRLTFKKEFARCLLNFKNI